MKTVIFKVSGEAVDSDFAVLAYTTPRGGMSSVNYRVKGEKKSAWYDEVSGEPKLKVTPGDTPSSIATALADAINRHGSEFLQGEFIAVAKDDLLIVTCSDLVSDVIFIPQIDGTGTGKIELIG
jgi:hypothetical protein